MVLTIDLGNSTTSWIVFEAQTIILRHIASTTNPLPNTLFQKVNNLKAYPMLTHIFISSVVPQLDDQLSLLCKNAFGLEPVFLTYRLARNMAFSVDNPAELGADRIAACLGALEKYAVPLIIIDSGTATTFDLVDENRIYQGGAIAPGLKLLSKSLTQNTAKLMASEFQIPKTPVAKNTTDHIHVGTYHFFIGGIERLIGIYRLFLGQKVTVIACGGGFSCLPVLPNGIDYYEADLVHMGLLGLGGNRL